MTLWKSLMKGDSSTAKVLAALLTQIETDKAPIRIEIEGTPVRFNSRLILKNEVVVVAKPLNLRDGLEAGSYVRFRVPGHFEQEVRLEVQTPHFNLSSGNAVFLCKLPTDGLSAAKRKAERYNVSRYANVHFIIPSRARIFRVLDLSLAGCKVMTSLAEAQMYFPLGTEIEESHIRVGKEAKVEFRSITPRAHHRTAVGCEFAVKEIGPSQVYLEHLLNSLEKAESQRYAI
jgi:hypothetical protein